MRADIANGSQLDNFLGQLVFVKLLLKHDDFLGFYFLAVCGGPSLGAFVHLGLALEDLGGTHVGCDVFHICFFTAAGNAFAAFLEDRAVLWCAWQGKDFFIVY
jgi:hypothetical protein